MRQEKVDIEVCEMEQPHSRLPDWNNFWLIPSKSPHLREFVERVEWDAYSKRLFIEIKETPAFSAFSWFDTMPVYHGLVNNEEENKDLIAICFFDEEDHELARLEFEGLALSGHKCVLSHSDEDDDKGLIHEVTVQYQRVRRAEHDQETPQEVFDKFHELAIQEADAEWQGDKEPVLALEKIS